MNETLSAATFNQNSERLFMGTPTGTIITHQLAKDDIKVENFANISKTRINSLSVVDNELLIGAKDINLSIYDIEKKIQIWRAKNLPYDELNLKPKVNNFTSIKSDSIYYTISAFN